ncbi:Lcl C-terminal domain-containing protein [Vallitalea okinawensis]|uniref:Lcl C-terminal domain-containing protein n=1 Tax=Vallitalea okinawensis TaxID=2078660 RepID=UPI001A9A5C08|nr:DUF1566 domain-containing protein [Vallitalea okinawensis]
MKLRKIKVMLVISIISTLILGSSIVGARSIPDFHGPLGSTQLERQRSDSGKGLEVVLNEFVNNGLLSESEAEELMQYLEENRPQLDGQVGLSGQRLDLLTGAVEAGIITEDQANSLREVLVPPQGSGMQSGNQGMQQGPGMQSGNQGMQQGPGMQSGNQGMQQGPGMQSENQGMQQGSGMQSGNQGMQQNGVGEKTNSGNMLSVEEANEIEAELLAEVGYTSKVGGYPIVDTGQTTYYSNTLTISEPDKGEDYYGQDATYQSNQSSYTDNGDGTVTDNVTGLMWQQDPGEKITWEEAVNNLEDFQLAGYDDWRLPTIKELYSLVQFTGVTGKSSDTSIPYIDTDYFEFEYGDAAGEERFIDSQMATSTIYDSPTMSDNTTVFGFNFADGRIKGYPITKEFYVYYVRGNTGYGQNQFVNNGDGTITDLATGLMWMTYDSGYYNAGDNSDGTMDWDDALEWCEDLEFAGYDDWKLPDAKELQSLVDYNKSPDTTDSAAISDMFYCTPVANYSGQEDYGFYWSSTTHLDGKIFGGNAVYLAFGRGMGAMNGNAMDVHGAGCQRSDPKTGDRDDYPASHENAPQGDEQKVFNMVRAVRVID